MTRRWRYDAGVANNRNKLDIKDGDGPPYLLRDRRAPLHTHATAVSPSRRHDRDHPFPDRLPERKEQRRNRYIMHFYRCSN